MNSSIQSSVPLTKVLMAPVSATKSETSDDECDKYLNEDPHNGTNENIMSPNFSPSISPGVKNRKFAGIKRYI